MSLQIKRVAFTSAFLKQFAHLLTTFAEYEPQKSPVKVPQ
jgi:hypothetical protein